MKVTIEKVDKLVDRADVSYETAKEALESANGDLLDAVILLEREGKLGPNAGRKKVTTYTTDGRMPAVIGQSYGLNGSAAPINGTALQTRVDPNFTAGNAGGQNPGGQPGGQQGSNAQSSQQGGFAKSGQPGGQQGSYAHGGQQAYRQQAGGQQGGPHRYKDESAQFEDNAKKFFFWLGRLIRGGCVNYFEVWRRGERVLYFPVILFLFCLIHWVFWIFLVFLFVGLLAGCRYRFSGPHLGRDSVSEGAGKAQGASDGINNEGMGAGDAGEEKAGK